MVIVLKKKDTTKRQVTKRGTNMACITGDETGIVKIWDIQRSTGAVVDFSYGENQPRTRGIRSMCWASAATDQVILNRNDGTVALLDLKDKLVLSNVSRGVVAASATAMSVIRDKLCIVTEDGSLAFTHWDPSNETYDDEQNGDLSEEAQQRANVKIIRGNAPAEAIHINRRFGLAAVGGKENDLCVYDVCGERTEPLFQARNVRDHVLDVPMPVYVTTACVVNPFIYAISTAYHQVRFYDRRASTRPVQEFEIDREIQRRPTMMLQWNCNKYLIGEASGDVHLYDTRRGFASRAKLRGGVGSVRHMVKHPEGHQILGVTGLDRKARLFHVPTGKLIMSVYVKQRATCMLLDRNMPLSDNASLFSGVVNGKVPERIETLGDAVWDDMEPVVDDFEVAKAQNESVVQDATVANQQTKNNGELVVKTKKLEKRNRDAPSEVKKKRKV